jgi:hypothetical protein
VNQNATPQTSRNWQPTLLAERGVGVPWTTPSLSRARVRQGARYGLELVVHNFGSQRGAYIVPLDTISAYYTMTLYDRKLVTNLIGTPRITPAAIRSAALEVAAHGLARREAMKSARAALAADQQQRLMANLDLTLELIRQVEPHKPGWEAPERSTRLDLARRARIMVEQLAPSLGRSPESVTRMLEHLAALFCCVGIGPSADNARLRGQIADVQRLRAEMQAWQRDCPAAECPDAALVETAASLTAAAASAELAQERNVLGNLPQLLQRWARSPESVVSETGRTEWLLDGWNRICLVWECAEMHEGRQAALQEMAEMVAAMRYDPAEPDQTQALPLGAGGRRRSAVRLASGWKGAANLSNLVRWNEHMQAMEFDGHARGPGK